MFCCPRCSHLSTILNNIVEPESGVTTLFSIVDNCEQCGQQNIVQSCFHQYCINLSACSLVCDRNYCNVMHFDKEEQSHEMFARLMREARCPCLWMSVAVL
jgi:hypothetical protein